MKIASNRTGTLLLSLVALLGVGAGGRSLRRPLGPPVHQQLATPQTVTVGYAAAAPPHLRIQSGDVVQMQTLVARSNSASVPPRHTRWARYAPAFAASVPAATTPTVRAEKGKPLPAGGAAGRRASVAAAPRRARQASVLQELEQ